MSVAKSAKTTPVKTKLTLSIDTDLIEYGKRLARREGRSLSALLQSYLEGLRRGDERTLDELLATGRKADDLEVPQDLLALVPDPPEPMPEVPLAQLRREYHAAYVQRKSRE